MCPISPLNAARQRFAAISRIEAGHFPTPVVELPNLRRHLACTPTLLLKHDDWSGPGFGGNKVRKLEYYFARALAQGYDTVITCGGEASNHCRVTAALAARFGLACHLVLNPAVQRHPASLMLAEAYGAEIHRVPGRTERSERMSSLAAELGAKGHRAIEIPLGASTPLGALGFVRAAEELLAQTTPGWIVHSTSSGGTQAGLIAGLRLAGSPPTRVLGISADDPAAEITETVRTIISGIELQLDAPACSLQGEILVDDTFAGPAYGVPTPASDEATTLLARLEGILLDPVYTAKAFAGLLAGLSSGRFHGASSILFWHTGGQMALFSPSR